MVVRLVDVVDAPLRTFAVEAKILNTSPDIENFKRGRKKLMKNSIRRTAAAENA